MKKVNIFSGVLLLLSSFNVMAELARITAGGYNPSLCLSVFNVSTDQIVDLGIVRSIAASKVGQDFSGWRLVSVDGSGLGAQLTAHRSLNCRVGFTLGVSCSPPSEIDPDTGICGEPEPPTCPDGQVYNPVTGQCEPDTSEGFCESDEFTDLLVQAEQECAAQYPNHYSYVTHSCTDSQNYSILCNQGAPRGDDGDGGDDGSGGDDGDNGDGDDGNGDDGSGGDDGSTPNPDDSGAIVEAINNASDSITNNQSDLLDATQSINNTLDTTIKDAISNSTNELEDINQTGFDGVVSSQEQVNQAVNALISQNAQDASKLQNDIRGVRDSVDGLAGSVTASQCQSFNCTGVEAICYLAKKRWLDECQQQGIDTDFSDEGNNLRSALGQFSEDAKDNNGAYTGVYSNSPKTVDALLDTFNESNGLNFESGCPSPIDYDAGIATFSIDFTPFCDLAIFVRALLLTTVSYLVVMLFAKYL